MATMILARSFGIQSNDKRLRKYYLFPLPDVTEANFYNHVRGYNAFFSSLRRRNWNRKKQVCYSASHVGELKELSRLGDPQSKRFLEVIESGVPTKCKDIRDFFKRIGYDYKNKRYTGG